MTIAEVTKKAACKPVLFKSHHASKFLEANGNYIDAGKGALPYIDVKSEGFDLLPLEEQVASLKRYSDDKELEVAFLKKLRP